MTKTGKYFDNNRDKIAFVDFDKEYQAKFATEHLNGYRFPGAQKGICKCLFGR